MGYINNPWSYINVADVDFFIIIIIIIYAFCVCVDLLERHQWLLLHQKALKLQFSRSKEMRLGFKFNHWGI